MLYMIGIGLNDEKDISIKGLEKVKKADFVYLEDLKNKIIYFAKSVSDARQNKYYTLTQRIIK